MPCRDHNVEPRVSFDARGLCGASLCVLIPPLAWFGLQGTDFFRLTLDSWSSGSWHALWSSHLLHYTLEHFIWDALMFSVFASLLWREERWRMWIWLFVAAPVISLFVFAVEPQLSEYRGLSALDTMLYTRFCLGFFKSNKDWDRWLFGALPVIGLGAKIIYEFSSGTAIFVTDLGPNVMPLPSAHFAGMVMGGFWFLVRAPKVWRI